MSTLNEIPFGWSNVTLGEIVKSANTGLDAIGRAPIVEEETGIKCFRIQDASQKKAFKNWGNTKVEDKNYEKFKLLKGDILIARTGNTIGVHYLVKNDLKSVFNNGLIRLRVNEKTDYEFFYKIIESSYFKRYIQSVAYGTSTQPNMQINVLLGLETVLPSIEEQKAITNIIAAFDDKIEILQDSNKTLEKTAQAIFKEWFGIYLLGYDLPDGWRAGKLGTISDHIKDSVKPFNNQEKDYLYYSLSAYDNGLVPKNEKGVTIKSYKYKVCDNCFLVSKLSPFSPKIWTIFDSDDNHICSTEFQVVKPKSDTVFALVHCFLNSKKFTAELCQNITGTCHQRVKPQDIFDVGIIIPNENSLVRFRQEVDAMVLKKNINHRQIQALKKTRDTLLGKLINLR